MRSAKFHAAHEPTGSEVTRERLRDAVLRAPLVDLPIPDEVRDWAAGHGIETVADALDSPPTKRRVRITAAEFHRAIGGVEGGAPSPRVADEPIEPLRLEDFPTYEALWAAAVSTLPRRIRKVLSRRTGVGGKAATLAKIGVELGLTRERIRQIEASGLQLILEDPGWIEALKERLDERLGGAALGLEALADEPFWAPALKSPDALRFLFRHVIPGDISMVVWDGGRVITPRAISDPEAAFRGFTRDASKRFPLSFDKLDAGARAAGDEVGPGFGALFAKRLEQRFLLDPVRGEATGLLSSRAHRIQAYLLERDAPASIAELRSRFGSGPLPADVIHFNHGLLVHRSQIEDFDHWMERLVPHVRRIMAARNEVQWSTSQLLATLGELVDLPEQLNPWLLGSILRLSGAFHDLGRQRFGVLGARGQPRAQYLPTLVRLLKEAGRPLSRDKLREGLGAKTTFNESTFSLITVRIPLLPVDADRIGLIDRDVPGGRDAMLRATQHLAVELRARRHGISFAEALEIVIAADDACAGWTREIIAALPRLSRALISNRNGIGLASWGSARVPSRNTILRQLLEAPGGTVRIDEAVAAIEAVYREKPTRNAFSTLLYQLGLRVDAGLIVPRESLRGSSR